MAAKKRIMAEGLILPPELPKWLKALSPHIKAKLKARIKADGYECDAETWFRDMVTTAACSSQGFILRFGKLKDAKEETAVAVDVDLFNPAPEGGAK